MIHDTGKEGKESFNITAELNSETEEKGNMLDDSTENLEKYINDEFYLTLINRIKSEVKIAITEHISTANHVDQSYNYIKSSIGRNDMLIESLKSEIDFLRKELQSKDKIMEIIIKEKSFVSNKNNEINANDNANYSNFESVQRNKKPTHKNQSVNNDVNKSRNTCSEMNDGKHVLNSDKNLTNNKKKKNVTTIGDSMIKNIKPYKMRQGMETNDKVHIKSFPGASVGCMVDCVKPSLKYNSDTFLLHCETNDLRSEKSSEEIATSIINLAKDIKSDENNVIISSIVTRSDALNTKGMGGKRFFKR